MVASIFRTKSLEQIAADRHGRESLLKRTLGPSDLLALTVGSTFGVAVFIVIGEAAARYAGPAIVLSITLAAVAAVLSALCYAELAAMVPISGSAYTYAYASLGELPSWLIGWTMLLCYVATAVTLSIGWSSYGVSLLGRIGVDLPAVSVDAPAVFIVLTVTWLLGVGIRESASANTLLVVLRVLVAMAVIAVGLWASHPSPVSPVLPPNTGVFGEFGWSGVLTGAGYVFLLFFGIDAAATSAEEARHPSRDIPIGMIGGAGLTTLLYGTVTVAMILAVGTATLNGANPISRMFDAAGVSPWAAGVAEAAVLVVTTSFLVITLLAIPRVLYQMTVDGLLPGPLARLHTRYRTPFVGSTVAGVITAVLASRVPLSWAVSVASLCSLAVFGAFTVGVVVLRFSRPAAMRPRPYRVPFLAVVASGGLVLCLLLAAALILHDRSVAAAFAGWMLAGAGVYWAYGYRHSRLRKSDGLGVTDR